MRAKARGPVSSSEGMVLVLTLMVLAILTALVVEFSYAMYVNVSALNNWQVLQKLSFLAKSGVTLASKTLSGNINQKSYTYPGTLEFTQARPMEDFDGSVSLRIDDENGKFNLNSLVYSNGLANDKAYKSFVRLLDNLDLNHDIADRVSYWINPDSVPGPPDSGERTKNGYLDSVDELLLVYGISRADYEKLLPYVTIYGNGLVNINSAEVPVLVSLSDSIDNETAQRIVKFRELSPFETPQDIFKVAGFETLGTALMGSITVKGSSFRITSGSASGKIKRTIECVIDMAGSSPVIRYWKEI